MRHILLFTTVILCTCLSANATTLSGTISSEDGSPLPFASIYLQGTTNGTTSNVEGFYSLEVPTGVHVVVFQYVGYTAFKTTVKVGDDPVRLDVQLSPAEVKLNEVTIDANEDPAYRVIRAAIAKREYHKRQVTRYQFNAYIKGLQKISDLPKELLGTDGIESILPSVDSSGQGVVYLSESVSTVYRMGRRSKEVMRSSKVSGNSNGFSFNRASAMDFSFYDNSITLNRALVSPIADNALRHYNYRLEGYFMEGDYKINKIRVIPKQEYGPALRGHIYIVEDLWNIHSTDLYATEKATQINLLDTLYFRQVFVPVQSPDVWMMLSQTISFDISLMGIKLVGSFSGVFSDYDLDPPFDESLFSKEVLSIEEGANAKREIYWDSIRPIPLTSLESRDYRIRDSIEVIQSSRSYLDSMDAINNRPTTMNLYFGYTYRNTYKKRSFTIKAPINTVQFNVVQGYTFDLNTTYKQQAPDNDYRWFSIAPSVQYGFVDQTWRPSLAITRQFNGINDAQISASAGFTTAQFNEDEPVCTLCNTSLNLYYRLNFIRLYEKHFATLRYQQELFNGLWMQARLSYEQRAPLSKRTDQYWIALTGSDGYDDNIPQHPEYLPPRHDAIVTDLAFRIRLGQRYVTYPNRRVRLSSRYPDIWLYYRGGRDTDGSGAVNYDRIGFSTRKTFQTGIWGYSSLALSGGYFLNRTAVPFPDYFHFLGKRTLTSNSQRYDRSFFRMPYYQYSTSSGYLMMHYAHDFNGLLLSRVPLLKRTGWSAVIGGKALYTLDQGDYYEAHFGFNKIGWSIFRLFRVDAAIAFNRDQYLDWGVILGYNLPF